MSRPAPTYPHDLAVRRVQNDSELRQATALMRQAETGGAVCCWPETHGVDYSPQERARVHVAVLHEEVAGACRLHSEVMRLGEARLRIGQISMLSVEERFRGKGVQRALLAEVLQTLRGQQSHLALLHAEPGIHYPLGFTTAYPEHSVTLDTRDAVRAGGDWKIREAKPGDIPALSRMHSANDTGIDGGLLRPEAVWPERWPRDKILRVITDPEGMPAAYFVAEPDAFPFDIIELGLGTPEAAPALLACCGDLANDAACSSVRFRVPPTHPFAGYLRRFPCAVEARYAIDGGAMLALCDVGETLESLVPEWEQCLSESIAATWRNEVTLVVEGHSFRIRNTRGVMDVAPLAGRNKLSLSQADLLQLIMGYAAPEAILPGRKALIDTEARTLLRAIFPWRAAHLWPLDRL